MVLAILTLLALTPVAFSQSGGDYTLESGGMDNQMASAGGAFQLVGTMHKSGAPMSGGPFMVQGGLNMRGGDAPASPRVYLPVVAR
jgi:hypothetical protein